MKSRLTTIALLTVIVTFGAAAAARAETGLVGYFQFPVSGISGVGVNHAGTGAAAPGDLYVSGAGGGVTERVFRARHFQGQFPGPRRFRESGKRRHRGRPGHRQPLLRRRSSLCDRRLPSQAWLRRGPNRSARQQRQRTTASDRRRQRRDVHARLLLQQRGSIVTKPIPYDATAAEVETAVNALIAVGEPTSSATVTGGPGDPIGSNPYMITFDGGPIAGDDVGRLSPNGSKLTGSPSSLTIYHVVSGGAVEICTPEDVCAVDVCAARDLCNLDASYGHDAGGTISRSRQRRAGSSLRPQRRQSARCRRDCIGSANSLRPEPSFAPSAGT